MKKFIFLLIVAGLQLHGHPALPAEGSAAPPPGGVSSIKEKTAGNGERRTALRESEILGTLEKPRLSTDIPWHNPELLPEETAGPQKSFIREIFRPLPSGPSPESRP